jgi:hypothetical protein
MNAAALLLMRAMPETGHFGWDWLSDGRRWKVKAIRQPVRDKTRSPSRRQSEPSLAGNFD